jgi:hypothetical protein
MNRRSAVRRVLQIIREVLPGAAGRGSRCHPGAHRRGGDVAERLRRTRPVHLVLDLSALSLVKTYVHSHGRMSWEPKGGFHAGAGFYGNQPARR